MANITQLTKLVSPVTGGGDLNVGQLIKILTQFPKDAMVFLYDTEEEEDFPLSESEIYYNETDNEVYFGN